MSGGDSPQKKDSATHDHPSNFSDYERLHHPTLALQGMALPMRPAYAPIYEPQHQYYYHPHHQSTWGYNYNQGVGVSSANLPFPQDQTILLPEITSFAPENSSSGHKLYIWLQSSKDLFAQPQINYTVMFRNKRVPTELKKFGIRGIYHQYALISEIPMLDHPPEDFSQSIQVPLCLDMEDSTGQKLGFWRLGNFTYDDNSDLSGSGQSQTSSRKRKRDPGLYEGDIISPPPKTQGMDYMYPGSQIYAPMSSGIVASQSANTPLPRNQPYGYSEEVPTSLPYQGQNYAPVTSQYNPPTVHSRAQKSPTSNPAFQGPTPPDRKSSHSPGGHLRVPMERTNSVPVARAKPSRSTEARKGSAPSGSSSSNPPLVRTSTMSHQSSSASASRSPEFNPYTLYPTKVALEFDGDLDSMLEDWSEEEKSAKRRLVQFDRHQSGSVLRVSFRGVQQEERSENSICVSCIWWEGKREAFVTSVDTLNLLQSLIGARFTVEEKNRTRRNLEGFRPLTVAKSKAESADFFRLIMNFTNPKPRNIEKDVKVFPWKVMALALKKVIAKYSPDYASTAGVLAQLSSDTGTRRSSNTEQDPELSPDREASPGSSEDGSDVASGAETNAPPETKPLVSRATGNRMGVAAQHPSSSYLPPAANVHQHVHARSHFPMQQSEGSQDFAHHAWEFGAYFDTNAGLTATPSTAAQQYEQQITGIPDPHGQPYASRQHYYHPNPKHKQ